MRRDKVSLVRDRNRVKPPYPLVDIMPSSNGKYVNRIGSTIA